MAGGTSRKNHSEVGSSYIHFNFTPNQDKATPSLLGDVPSGVMLRKDPIFLGGQGGMVGPLFLNYGTVIAAGTLQRKDEREENRLLFGGALRPGNVRHSPGIYQNVSRIAGHNIRYIGNLIALDHWYRHVRSRFISNDFPEALLDGLRKTLALAIDERIKRLKGLFENVSKMSEHLLRTGAEHTPTRASHQRLITMWPGFENGFHHLLTAEYDLEPRRRFFEELEGIQRGEVKSGYIGCIRQLSTRQVELGTQWLQGIVNHATETLYPLIEGL
jgi:UDP-N-acetylglucosamine/UDP-N-acetylgalactosamine diphosphorylase